MKMNDNLRKLPTPAVVVDLEVAEQNIREMAAQAGKHGINHRPHIKTHRSGFFAKLQMENGCHGITAAKLGEAEVMADNGINDIFVAYPIIGEDKLQRLYSLSQRVHVSTLVNSVEGAKALSDYFEKNGKTVDVLIEIDGGLNRGGVGVGRKALEFAEKIRDDKGLHIQGLMYYGGLIYNSHNTEEVRCFAQKEHDDLVETAAILSEHGFEMNVLSAGSSYSGKYPELLEGITEIRSGHYIFNDCSQLDVGLATPEQCALNVITTVVAKPDEHTVICDMGTKTLTSDGCHYRKGYGYITDYPEIEIYALNEEHAFLRSDGINPLKIGQKIAVIPNHACVVTNLTERIYGFRDGQFEQMIDIDARAKSV